MLKDPPLKKSATWFVKKWLHTENQEVESTSLRSLFPVTETTKSRHW